MSSVQRERIDWNELRENLIRRSETESDVRIKWLVPVSSDGLNRLRQATQHRVTLTLSLDECESNQHTEQLEQHAIERLWIESIDIDILFGSRNSINIEHITLAVDWLGLKY